MINYFKSQAFVSKSNFHKFAIKGMTTKVHRRLICELKKLQEDVSTGISATPTENNIMLWNAVIFGPQDTIFENGTFKLTIKFPDEYPNKPPIVHFITQIFHPNIYQNGQVCLDILQDTWSPCYNVSAILTSIQSVLNDPNPSSAANPVAAKLYNENRREYERRIKACVEQSLSD